MSIHDKYLFQFTRPQEARPALRTISSASASFQFTRPQEARHRVNGILIFFSSFNSRARKRRDAFRRAMSVHAHDVSIHAPARGATVASDAIRAGVAVSIHAPARGATCSVIRYGVIMEFQFTRPQEARQKA